jgi:hypothetical protein
MVLYSVGWVNFGLVAFVVPVAPVAHHVNENVAVEPLAEVGGQLGAEHHASGSSPFTCSTGASMILATSVL